MEASLRKMMLERELRGLELELQVLRNRHVVDTQAIYDLERERADLVQELDGSPIPWSQALRMTVLLFWGLDQLRSINLWLV